MFSILKEFCGVHSDLLVKSSPLGQINKDKVTYMHKQVNNVTFSLREMLVTAKKQKNISKFTLKFGNTQWPS